MRKNETVIFNQLGAVAEGWYWALRSKSLKKERVQAASLTGRDLAIYRAADGSAVALDAYCPHMGAHLAQGRVEGRAIRCFFHNWKYDASGRCVETPCLPGRSPAAAKVKSYPVCERYGLIWVWIGDTQPSHEVPAPPELRGRAFDYSLGNRFRKKCHPNVVMINAIDEQHFQTVHRLPGHVLKMDAVIHSRHNIEFCNTGHLPRDKWLGRLVARFYKGPLTYKLSYWYGSTGTVCLGPDFLHLYLMFALRQTPEGHAEGQAIVFTKKRSGPWGWVFNRLVLWATKMVSLYFAKGDTKVFEAIRFDFKTPIPADRSVISFIRHLERQALVPWANNGHPVNSTAAEAAGGTLADVAR